MIPTVKRALLNTYCIALGLLEGACGPVSLTPNEEMDQRLNLSFTAMLEWHSKTNRSIPPADLRNDLSRVDALTAQMEGAGLKFQQLIPNETLTDDNPFYSFNMDWLRQMRPFQPAEIASQRAIQISLLQQFDQAASAALGGLQDGKISDLLRAKLRAVRFWSQAMQQRQERNPESLTNLGIDTSVVLSNEAKLGKRPFGLMDEADRDPQSAVESLVRAKMDKTVLSFTSAKKSLRAEMNQYLSDCIQFQARYEPLLYILFDDEPETMIVKSSQGSGDLKVRQVQELLKVIYDREQSLKKFVIALDRTTPQT